MLLREFFFAGMAVLGFALLFNIPKKSFLMASIAGGTGWIVYVYFLEIFNSTVGATFIGACSVAIVSEIFARTFKEAVTVFIIPAIIPLVPGSGMYFSMIAIIENNYNKFASIATETLFIASSISVAILIVSSITRIIMNINYTYKNRL